MTEHVSREAVDVEKARARVAGALDPAALEVAGHRVIDLLSQHFVRAQQSEGNVLNWRGPLENIATAKGFTDRASEKDGAVELTTEAIAGRVAELATQILANGQTLHDPRYVGHQVPPPMPLAGLFDAIGSITNQVMAIYEMGPWASSVEEAMVQTLGERIGYAKDTFAGFVTSGGSLANLTALLTARNVAMKQVWREGMRGAGDSAAGPVVITHSESHYCVARAVGILGIGTNNLLKCDLDKQHRMDPAALDAMLTKLARERRPVIAVVASACSTKYGAFDPLNDIADVCVNHGVWLHVDAAHGGAACMSHAHRHLVEGLDRADSVVWDAHKMLHVPALCTFVFYRNREHRFAAFEQDAPYLFDPSAPGIAEFDSGLKTVECTKRAEAFGLWGLWSLFGPGLFADIVDVTFAMGQRFHRMLNEAEDFTPLHEPQCNIVVFRHVPQAWRALSIERVGELQLALRRRVIESGKYYLVPSKVEGIGALRVVITNPLTNERHLEGLMNTLREEAADMRV
ncbi:MAG: pyridoxal-dependent decarboxylase [Phycisphaeraceae bacterium]